VDAGRPTVLVVEDEPLILLSIADELREAGFDVLEAQSAADALRLLEANAHIRLIFTDVDMPGSMDGLGLSAVVRERWPPVLIIVTSGKRVPETAALPSGSEFLPKPYTSRGVVRAMRSMLA
jgi:two-component system, response regulator PdtaR